MLEISVAEAVFLILAVIECRLQLGFRGVQLTLDTCCTCLGRCVDLRCTAFLGLRHRTGFHTDHFVVSGSHAPYWRGPGRHRAAAAPLVSTAAHSFMTKTRSLAYLWSAQPEWLSRQKIYERIQEVPQSTCNYTELTRTAVPGELMKFTSQWALKRLEITEIRPSQGTWRGYGRNGGFSDQDAAYMKEFRVLISWNVPTQVSSDA